MFKFSIYNDSVAVSICDLKNNVVTQVYSTDLKYSIYVDVADIYEKDGKSRSGSLLCKLNPVKK